MPDYTKWADRAKQLDEQDPMWRLTAGVTLLVLLYIPIYILNLRYPALTLYVISSLGVFSTAIAIEIKKRTNRISYAMFGTGAVYLLITVVVCGLAIAQAA